MTRWLLLIVPLGLLVWFVLPRAPTEPVFTPKPAAEIETLMQGAFVAARPAMVQLQSLHVSSDGEFIYSRQGRASGFIFSADGYAITAYHAVVGIDRLEALTTKQELLPARVMGFDESRDLAVIQIASSKPLPFVQIEFDQAAKINDPLVEIGNSGDDFIQPRYGQVQGFLQSQELLVPTKVMLSNVPIKPGDSGGAVINFAGKAMALGIGYAQNAISRVSYLVPLSGLAPWIEKLKTGAQLLLPSVGFRVAQDDGSGLEVTYIRPNSPAQKAGLSVDAEHQVRLLEVDGVRLETLRDYNRIVRSKKVGDVLNFKLVSDNNLQTIALRLE